MEHLPTTPRHESDVVEEVQARKAALHQPSDLRGLIKGEQVAPPSDPESATSLPLIERAALALLKESLKDGQPNIPKALKAAGINPEVYAQMVQSPDFWPVFQTTCINYILPGRYPRILQAASEAAMAGDMRATKMFIEVANLQSSLDPDELQRSMSGMEDDSLAVVFSETMTALEDLKVEMVGPEIDTEALVEEARNEALDVKTDTRERVELDHGELHEDV